MQAVADSYLARFAASILSALERIRASGRDGNPNFGEFWTLAKAAPYEDIYLEAVVAGAEQESTVRFQSAFKMINPRAVEIANLRAGELVAGLSRESRAAVSQITIRTVGGEHTVAEAARLLRTVVGLDAQRAQAVVNYARDRASAGLTESQLRTAVDQYAERQLAARASTIARTETMRAAHDGQKALWDEAASQGLFNPADAQRVWVVTDDDRLCAECAPMDGQIIDFGGRFESGETTTETPPVHPQCRCTSSLLV